MEIVSGTFMAPCFNKVSESSIAIVVCYLIIKTKLSGGMYLPSSDSGRLIVGTWWLGVLVVVTTYCGNLVAFLTFPKIDNPISNLHELLNTAHDVTWSIRSKTFFEYYIKVS